MVGDEVASELAGRIEELLAEVETLPDAAARDTATELVQSLVELYGEGLARIVEHAARHDEDGGLAADLAGDELVSNVLLLHGLHPVALEDRVRGALEEMRPYLETHGGDVQLLGVADGVVRLQLQGSCSGCPSSAVTLRHGIEDAIHRAAPDVERIEAEDAPTNGGLLQIEIAEPLTCPLPNASA